jgi:NADPH-dependent curcumin reductase CurA
MRNYQVRLKSRPANIARSENFEIFAGDITPPADGEFVVRNMFLSVEPAMRGWLADSANYAEPVAIGAVMRSLAVGEIVESRNSNWPIGTVITGWFGWQEFATVTAQAVVRIVTERDLSLSLSLGVLGINGVTALLALRHIGRPEPGDTVAVSTAAGGVGSAVGQIAKLMGCRTIGIAGGPEKVKACIDMFGYDEAFDYRADGLDAAIGEACPTGINVYFDNTSGPISDTVMRHLARRARVVVCGTSSISSWADWPVGPRPERHLLVKRASMQGFVIFDHDDEYDGAVAQLADWLRAGKLNYAEHILEGIDACPDAIARLYRGGNSGKLLVRI